VALFLQIVSMCDLGDFSDTTFMQNYVKIRQIFRCCKGQAEHLDLVSVIKQMIETSGKETRSLMFVSISACSTTHTEVNCRNRSRNI
jgi:hypothetical protein